MVGSHPVSEKVHSGRLWPAKAGQRGRPLRGDQMRGYPAARPDFRRRSQCLERPAPALPEQSRTGKGSPAPPHRT